MSKYTRISLNSKLQNVVSEVQADLPLYSVNDVIHYLITVGYKEWKDTTKTHTDLVEYAHTNPSFDFLNDEEEDIYMLSK